VKQLESFGAELKRLTSQGLIEPDRERSGTDSEGAPWKIAAHSLTRWIRENVLAGEPQAFDFHQWLRGLQQQGVLTHTEHECLTKLSTACQNSGRRRFRIALSYPGEIRGLVQKVAEGVAAQIGRDQLFYDRYYEAELARPDLDVYLQNIYAENSDLLVIFLCADYEDKEWCGVEWRVVRALIKARRTEDIMLLRTDDAAVTGLLPIHGYADIRGRSAQQVTALIMERLVGSPSATAGTNKRRRGTAS
jgi:hypothetical protein